MDSPERVGDRVFGEYTRDSASLREGAQIESTIVHPWDWYFDGERPDWYIPWQFPAPNIEIPRPFVPHRD